MTNSNYLDARTPEEREVDAKKPAPIFTMTDADEAQHEVDKQNDLLNKHFEEQRIRDLKVDIDTVLESIVIPKSCHRTGDKKCAGCKLARLKEDLEWYKELL